MEGFTLPLWEWTLDHKVIGVVPKSIEACIVKAKRYTPKGSFATLTKSLCLPIFVGVLFSFFPEWQWLNKNYPNIKLAIISFHFYSCPYIPNQWHTNSNFIKLVPLTGQLQLVVWASSLFYTNDFINIRSGCCQLDSYLSILVLTFVQILVLIERME